MEFTFISKGVYVHSMREFVFISKGIGVQFMREFVFISKRIGVYFIRELVFISRRNSRSFQEVTDMSMSIFLHASDDAKCYINPTSCAADMISSVFA